MPSFVSNRLRPLFAVMLSALLAVGVLAAAPSAQAATTLTYGGWSQIFTDGDLWVSFTVDGDVTTGTMTATVAGKSVTLEAEEGSDPQQYTGMLRPPFPSGTQTVKATFTASNGVKTTGSGTVKVDPAWRYAKTGSAITWGVDPLRSKVVAEGGKVTRAGGAVADPSNASATRFPITDLVKNQGRLQAGGVATFTSARRKVTLSDLRWVGASTGGGSVVADVTYRHPGKATRSQRAVAVATTDFMGTGGDPWGYSSRGDLIATAAGAQVLDVASGADLGQLRLNVLFALKPLAANAKVALSPRSRTYGKKSTVRVSVTRNGVQAAGKVTVKAGSRSLGTVRLSQGKGSVSVPASLAAGSYKVTAAYKADYSPTGASARATLKVTKAKTATKVKLAKKKIKRKQRAKVSVRVRGKGTSLQPRGKVTVFDGKKRLKRVKTNAKGKVTVKLPKLKKGKHKLRIVFAGGKSFASSTGRVVLRVR